MTAAAIDFFSPLPPVPSGIADYSHDLLPYLERRYAVTVRDPSHAGGEGALPLYQIGNNEHHAAIYARALHQPGIVVLHDVVLHHLLGEMTLKHHDADTYRFTVAYGHSLEGIAAAHARVNGVYGPYQQFTFPCNALLLDRSLAVIVHSHDARARIEAAHPDLPVYRVPMGVPLPEATGAADVAAARARLGLPQDAFVIANFGFVTPIKRVDTLVRAFARTLAQFPAAYLCIVGDVSPTIDLMGQCRALGVAQRVRVTGYVPFEQWIDTLVACDVCVNLRFPTAGETSASLIRILGHGKPVLVSRYRQFRELPADAVGFVDLGPAEEELLHRYLLALAQDPDLRHRLGENGRRHALAEHRMENALEGYAAAIDDTMSRRGELHARVRARRPRLTGRQRHAPLPGGVTVRGLGPFEALT